MGRASSITPEIAEQLLADKQAKKSHRQMAKDHGLSLGSVNRYFESLGQASAPVIVQRQEVVARLNGSLWDTRTALDENYTRLINLIAKLDAGIVEVKGEWTTNTPITTLVAAIKEVRAHVETGTEFMRLLTDMRAIERWQSIVIEAIGEVDEPTKRRIIARLRESHALELLASGPGPR